LCSQSRIRGKDQTLQGLLTALLRCSFFAVWPPRPPGCTTHH
jgi:hypothetical protein